VAVVVPLVADVVDLAVVTAVAVVVVEVCSAQFSRSRKHADKRSHW